MRVFLHLLKPRTRSSVVLPSEPDVRKRGKHDGARKRNGDRQRVNDRGDDDDNSAERRLQELVSPTYHGPTSVSPASAGPRFPSVKAD